MRTIGRAVYILFLGLLIGAVHSYCAPFRMARPENNPAPPPAPVQPPAEQGHSPPVAPGAQGERLPAEANPAAPPGPAADAEPNYYIGVDQAKAYFDQGLPGNVVFVDARPLKDYMLGHVSGAMHLPTSAFDGVPQKAVDNLPGMTVVVYCHGATCTDSQYVMSGLQQLKRDIGPIYIMKDGFDAWKARFPRLVEMGTDQVFGR